jgi:hypothetical protein
VHEILPFLILNADLRVDDVMRGHGLMCALLSFSLIFLPPFFFGECNYHISAGGHGALEIPNPFKLTKNRFCIREISEEYDMWIDFERMHWSVTLLFFFSSIEFSHFGHKCLIV